METSKKPLLIAGAAIAVAIIAFFVLTQSDNNDGGKISNLNANTSQSPTPIPTPTPTPTPVEEREVFNDSANKYSFSYPKGIFIPFKTTVSLPYGRRVLVNANAAFKHEINVEYCNLAGNCLPKTIDMSFGAVVIPKTLQSIKSDNPDFILSKARTGESAAEVYGESAEGEGMYYYFFQLPDNKTLVMYQRNINETIVTRYQKEPTFLKFAEQQRIMDSIIASLKISQ
jgi:hypothetical protein